MKLNIDYVGNAVWFYLTVQSGVLRTNGTGETQTLSGVNWAYNCRYYIHITHRGGGGVDAY